MISGNTRAVGLSKSHENLFICDTMNLLPRSHKDFGSAEYWEKFFRKRGGKAFEWYGEYGDLCGLLHKYIKSAEKVLMVGCGNSSLSADMYDVGYKNITNIDISEVVINQMTQKNAEPRPDMKFVKMDMLQMEFEDGEFSVVLDKGTLDAVLTDNSEAVSQKVDQMFAEIGRVLRVGGRYICVSLAQEHIIQKVLQYFPLEGWMVRICRVIEGQDEAREFHMPVFVYVFTKFRKMLNMTPILEVCRFEDKVERCRDVDQVLDMVEEMQQYGVIRQQLNKRSLAGEDISLDLYTDEIDTPRYTLHVMDSLRTMANKFAIFIVPEGREPEWMFSTAEGRKQLLDSTGYERLVVVTLHRDHIYGGIEEVKSELSSKVMELAPSNLGSKQVPFLSLGDDINKRCIKHRGHSELSGEFVVEDVASETQVFRRLVFLSNQNVVQSEARLIKGLVKKPSGKKKKQLKLDTNYLSSQYASVMVAGLALLQDFLKLMENEISLLLIGLGGGGLPMFIHQNYPKVQVEAVEIDPSVVSVAKDWFGLVEEDGLSIHIADGLEHIQELANKGEKRQIVMLDVDSKDTTVGMSCPPQAFIKPDFLQAIHSILETQGLLILNLVCRNQQLKESVISDIKSVFKTVYICSVPQDVNEVIYALPRDQDDSMNLSADGVLPKALQSNLRVLHEATKVQSKGTDVPELLQKLDGLKLL